MKISIAALLFASLVGCSQKTQFDSDPKTATADIDTPVVMDPPSPSIPSTDDLDQYFVSMNGERWEFKCENDPGAGHDCRFGQFVNKTVTLKGEPNVLYQVELRFRGVVETMKYKDGTLLHDEFYQGGVPDDAYFNIFKLSTSDPKVDYFMNAAQKIESKVYVLDYKTTIEIYGGSTVTLLGDVQNGTLIANTDRIKVPGLETPADLETGQFLQMDVVSVKKK